VSHLADALILFKTIGVDVPSLSSKEFTLACFRLAKRYHPDQGNPNHELMAKYQRGSGGDAESLPPSRVSKSI
jgi:hypothetical protein